jgi:hypothetical protein
LGRRCTSDKSQALNAGGALIREAPNCAGVIGTETGEDDLGTHPLEHANAFTPSTLQAFAERLGWKQTPPPTAYVTSSLKKVAASHYANARKRGRFGMICTEQYLRTG